MESDTAQPPRGKIFYGWWVVAASAVVNACGGGVYFYGFSVFFLPIKAALDISSAATSLVFSLSRAEGAVEGPIAGYLIDRYGPRRILSIGVVVVAIGYVMLSQVTTFWWFMIVYLGVISIAFNGSFAGSTMAVVNNWFIRRKGLAMAISIAAFSLGGAVIAPILSLGIQHFGWRPTAAAAGIFLAVTILPAARYLHPNPESMGLTPDGDQPESLTDQATRRTPSQVASVDFTVREALRTKSYWMLAVGTMVRTGTLGTIIVHFVPMMVWKGISEQNAALMLGAMAFLSVPMRIGLGWLGDRWSRSKMLAGGMALGGVSLFMFQSANGLWQLWAFLCVFSVVEGLSALNWALVGDYFGRGRFATLRGILSLVYSWGMIVMPVVAGTLFDRTESYRDVIWIFIGMYVVGTVVFTLIKRPRVPVRAGTVNQEAAIHT
ncbi:MAG: MFS transporter [SAR202 cluster bacterium]|nr:MFS transporter [SAR202 cluster bacterium]